MTKFDNVFVDQFKNNIPFDLQKLVKNMVPEYQKEYAEYIYKDSLSDISLLKRKKEVEDQLHRFMVHPFYEVEPMTQNSAVEIANMWLYPKPYDFYNIINDIEGYIEITNEVKRGDSYFQVLRNRELFGFVNFTKKDGVLTINLGMKPSYTGQGYGADFIKAIESYALEHYRISSFQVEVATFNERALILYDTMGYAISEEYTRVATTGEIPFVKMIKTSRI